MPAFAKVPQDLIFDPLVSDMAVRVYGAYAPHVWAFQEYGKALPTMSQVAKQIGRSVDSVQRSLKELESAGWLARETTANRHVWMRLNTHLPKGSSATRARLG